MVSNRRLYRVVFLVCSKVKYFQGWVDGYSWSRKTIRGIWGDDQSPFLDIICGNISGPECLSISTQWESDVVFLIVVIIDYIVVLCWFVTAHGMSSSDHVLTRNLTCLKHIIDIFWFQDDLWMMSFIVLYILEI